MNAPRARRRGWRRLDGWTVSTIVIAALATVPIFAVVYLALTPAAISRPP